MKELRDEIIEFLTGLSRATAYKSHPLGYENSIDDHWKADAEDLLQKLLAATNSPAPQSSAPDVESLSALFHGIYQEEAKRQGDVRHKDDYRDLPENIKEFDRVLARYVLANYRAVSDIVLHYRV